MGRIRRLPEEVISRIAAGEVVVSPSHALKELLENSLDAGSRNILLQLRRGGIQELQITDDGYGIEKSDFPALCERFTTSKLETMKDIGSLKTFGFRGEALSSISFVSRLSITSRTEDSEYAYRATFADGKMTSELEEVASAKRGTTVRFTDLFYNMPSRQRALNSAPEEYAKCLELVQKYCIEFPEVSFSVRKFGNNANDLRTNGGPNASRKNVIGLIYGSQVVKELIHFKISKDSQKAPGGAKNELFLSIPDYSVELYISGLGYHPKQNTLITFVNGRLVRNSGIKQAIEVAYQYTKTNYWAFVSVKVPSETVDPNVHPTKNLVHISHECLITDAIQKGVANFLQSSSYSRSMVLEKKPRFELREFSLENSLESSKNVTRVRTDSKQLMLREYSSNICLKQSHTPLTEENTSSKDIETNATEANSTSLARDPNGKEKEDSTMVQEFQSERPAKKHISRFNEEEDQENPDSSREEKLGSDLNPSQAERPIETKQIFKLADISSYVSDSHILGWSLNTESILMDYGMSNYQTRMKQMYLTEIEKCIQETEDLNLESLKSLTHSIVNGVYIGKVKGFWSLIQGKNKILLIKIDSIFKIALEQSIVCRLGFIPLLKLNPKVTLESLFLFSAQDPNKFQDQQEVKKFTFKEGSHYLELLKIFGIDFDPKALSFSTFPLCFGNFVPDFDTLPFFFESIILVFWDFHIKYADESFKISEKNVTCDKLINQVDSNLLFGLFKRIVNVFVEYYMYGIEDNELLYQSVRNNSNLILLEKQVEENIMELSSLEKLYRVFERC
ncbi:DNA mismatch repair protein Mlh1 [Cryptosporidium felis]|nr:DNA mismatch repair protein Mlh1 [Cryptosporidium felis]